MRYTMTFELYNTNEKERSISEMLEYVGEKVDCYDFGVLVVGGSIAMMTDHGVITLRRES